METYRVRVSTGDLVFSAAHFITFSGGVCEPLHGHNYRVAAEVHGPLGPSDYVVDFVALRETLKSLIDPWGHRVLLPTEHPQIRVVADRTEVEVRFGERRWVFPRGDCLLLPVANTTAELLARHLGRRLLDALQERTGTRPQVVRIEVEESDGLTAVCELRGE
jgi:6-pyruvoyltetrahydropterin/6-carboxytetrahydropterin synthase